jgi:hypothetical protein
VPYSIVNARIAAKIISPLPSIQVRPGGGWRPIHWRSAFAWRATFRWRQAWLGRYFKEDACIIDEQENHIVLTVRVPLDLIRDNHALLMALSEMGNQGRPNFSTTQTEKTPPFEVAKIDMAAGSARRLFFIAAR